MSATRPNAVRVFDVPADGPPIGAEQDALDLIGAVYGLEVDLIAIPASRLHADFLKLRTGMAGAFIQKVRNYGYRLAIVGDISADVAASDALRDFIRESNKGGQVVFVTDGEDLKRRL